MFLTTSQKQHSSVDRADEINEGSPAAVRRQIDEEDPTSGILHNSILNNLLAADMNSESSRKDEKNVSR